MGNRGIQPFTQKLITDIIWKIIREEYQSGAQLPPIETMAKNYGVGRTTVRESIKYLETTGLLYSVHGKGTFIADFVPSSNAEVLLEHIIDLRRMIEGFAIVKAAENRTETDIVELENLLTEMDKTSTNLNRFIESDRIFHFAVSKASHNPFIPSMLNSIFGMFSGVQDALINIPDFPFSKVRDEHLTLVNAIKDKNIRLAEDTLNKHLDTSQEIWKIKSAMSTKEINM